VDRQRDGLLAALVAARGLAGLHCRDQSLGERQLARGIVKLCGLFDHLRTEKHIARDGEAFADHVTAPVDAFDAGVRCDVAFRVDQMHLAVLATRVGEDERAHDIVRCHSLRQPREAARAVQRIDQRLRRQRTDAAMRMRTQRADREESARDDHAQSARHIARDDRPCHAAIRSRGLYRRSDALHHCGMSGSEWQSRGVERGGMTFSDKPPPPARTGAPQPARRR
jgi:hypothetical protein